MGCEVVYFNTNDDGLWSTITSDGSVYVDRWMFAFPDGDNLGMMVRFDQRADDDLYVVMIHVVVDR
jgi:hypothetical protein